MLIDVINTPSVIEGHIQKYLADNEKILIAAFGNPFWFYNIVLPQFRFGSDIVCDFAIVSGQSYSYEIHLIELKPSDSKIFTKKGLYAKDLNKAIKQVNDSENWINKNISYFQESLLKTIKKRFPDFDESFQSSRRFNVFRYIVIGRRTMLTDENNERRKQEREHSNLDIISYDRLIDVENKLKDMEENQIPFSKFSMYRI